MQKLTPPDFTSAIRPLTSNLTSRCYTRLIMAEGRSRIWIWLLVGGGLFVLFVVAVFGSDYIIPLQPVINKLIRLGEGNQTRIDGFHFKAFVRGDDGVATVEPVRQET